MKISIITPLYNQAEFIGRTIESIISQNVPNVEHIVVNDGSTDNAEKILEKYKNKIVYIKQKNSGQAHAMNTGLRAATGDIICCLNSDDSLLPNSLNTVLSVFTSKSDVFWLTGGCVTVDKNDKPIEGLVTIYKRIMQLFPYQWMLAIGNFIPQCSTFWRKSVTDEVGMFDETRFSTMDYDYWLRIIKKHPLYVVNKPLSQFRVHAASIGGSRFREQFKEDFSVMKKHIKNPLLRKLHEIHNHLILTAYKIIR